MKKQSLLFAFVFIMVLSLGFAWEDCPRRLVNDPYPGVCVEYTDTNNDNLCDKSQPAPVNNIKENVTQKEKEQEYHLISITIITTLIYLLSYFLLSKKQSLHKKIWNILLLATFIFTAFTSLVYLLRIDYNIITNLPFNIVFWHIEIGLIMILISVYHAVWHWRYFLALIKR